MKRILCMMFIVLCSFLMKSDLHAQEEQGEVAICIQDDQKETVQNVTVTIKDEQAQTKSYNSDQSGRIYLHGLSDGKYEIRVKPPKGYQSLDVQEFYVTSFNRDTQVTMTIQLVKEQGITHGHMDTWILFFIVCSFAGALVIYIIKTYNDKNFTQSFDDFML